MIVMIRIIYIFTIIVFVVSCKSEYSDYSKTEKGLTYKFHIFENDALKPSIGDQLVLKMYIISESKKMLYDYKNEGEKMKIILTEPRFNGDLHEGFAMMGIGDSASFIVDADSLKFHHYGEFPELNKISGKIVFEINLNEIIHSTSSDNKLKNKKSNKQFEYDQTSEYDLIRKYLKKNEIVTKPENSGLIIIEQKINNGPRPLNGQFVKVHYSGSFLNGETFDSSIGKDPLKFKLDNKEVIEGFEEAVKLLSIGSNIKIIIPSSIAYGAKGKDDIIPPYSSLIFEIQLIDIK